MSEFCEVAVHVLHLPSDVLVLPMSKALHDLLGTCCDLLVDLLLAFALSCWSGVDVAVGLQVHHGAKQVVPKSEAKRPVSLKLALCPAGHRSCPGLDLNFWSVWVSSTSPRHILFAGFAGVGHIWAGRAIFEAKREGHGKVPRLELVHKLIARAAASFSKPVVSLASRS